MNLNQVTLPVVDTDAAIAFSVHLSDAPWASNGAVVYFECTDLEARVVELQKRGFVFSRLPTDERWLWREARLQDPSGNTLCLFWAGQNRKNPPWRVPTSRLD